MLLIAEADLAVWAGVVFVLLVLVLVRFAWGPLSAALDRRAATIENQIAEARRQHDRAVELMQQYEQKMAQVKEEIRELLAEADRDAEHTRQAVQAEAAAAAQAERDRAVHEVQNAKDAALKEIGEASAEFAVQLAARIVEKELDAAQHTRLIRDSIAQFSSSTNGTNN